MPKLSEFFFGKKDKVKSFNNLNPQQTQLLGQFLQGLQGQGGQFGQQFGAFNPQNASDTFQQGVANPALRNFQQNIIPSIMERFADQGPSSALNNSLATAGQNLQSDLSSQLANFIFNSQQAQNQNNLQGLGLGLGTRQFSPYTQQGSPGIVPSLIGGLGGGLGQGLGNAGGSWLLNQFGIPNYQQQQSPYQNAFQGYNQGMMNGQYGLR